MMEAVTGHRLWQAVMRSDLMVSVGLVAILLLMIIPLPPLMLDLFLSLNITVALLILIISLYTLRALDFAIFPSILLATTLFRLSLNVASTRLILLNGDQGTRAAGSVIESFGQFVIGGNYVVGIVIFVILVIINFMVITKGAGRVAEVTARFTLDAMPGKQMAIDADLNAGLINEQEAKQRREDVTREADFYGAMDGASKFVRGDAIAGILITLINIGAGFVIGVLQQGMSPAEAAQNYTILTVGDGLVSQIPALIISSSAGILVTRSSGIGDFGSDLKAQLFYQPRAIWVVSGIIFLFALIPGLPFIPFTVLSLLLAVMAYSIQRKEQETATQEQEREREEAQAAEQQPPAEEDYEQIMSVDLLELEVGYGIIPFVDANQDGELLNRIRSMRKQFALDLGFVIPPIHIKDNLELKPNEYNILLKGVKIAGAEMMPGHYMAMDPGTATETVKGVSTVEPAFGLPAVWISEDKRERAQIAGYTVVDCTTVMATHISEVIKQHAHELLGRQEVQELLDNFAKKYPKLVEELVPNVLNVGIVMRVLQNLLREGVSIRDLRTILETLADFGQAVKDPDMLTEHVRQALARQISSKYAQEDGTLPVITLDRQWEERIQNAIQTTDGGSFLALDPRSAQKFLDSVSEQAQQYSGGQPVLLCSPAIRPYVRRLTERYLPNLAVLSHNEIAPQLNVRAAATLKFN